MKQATKKPTFKVKIDFNTWLEFEKGTTKDEVNRRIEKFKSKVGKYVNGGYANQPKDTF